MNPQNPYTDPDQAPQNFVPPQPVYPQQAPVQQAAPVPSQPVYPSQAPVQEVPVNPYVQPPQAPQYQPPQAAAYQQSYVPSIDPQYQAVSSVPVEDSSRVASDQTKIKVIGIALLTLSALTGFSYIAMYAFMGSFGGVASTSILQWILLALTIVVAIGLLRHNKIAYHAFNVVAALSILGGLVMLLPLTYLVLVFLPFFMGGSGAFALILLVPVFILLTNILFWIYGIIVLHPKRVRQLFH